ncbi:MAG: FAD:protein FMN transferase [Planctomycetes bacterium]|nr:FAD:protein FMN transferase [Planctomycetota bacterium]
MTVLMLLLALGEEYLTKDEAVRLFFKNGERVVEHAIRLDDAARRLVEKAYGSSVAPDQTVIVGTKEDRVVAYAMIVSEITKTLPMTFIVGVDPAGTVIEVAVMRHEEHIGTDCAKRRFLRQFDGKRPTDRLRMGTSYQPVSGATLSCNAVARGTRKVLAIIQHHFLDRPDHVKALLQEEPIRRQRYIMGSICTITAYGDRAAVEKAFDAIQSVDAALSNYRDDSDLARLHRDRSIQAKPELLAFVSGSLAFSERTEGAFDITTGPLVRLWGFHDGKHRVPSDEEIAAALARVGWRKIRVEKDTVTLPEGVELDPGAIGKGIGVDRAAEALKNAGIARALVDFGSSARAIGEWTLGIRDPFDTDRILGHVTLRDESISTSGGYEKFFEQDGRRYAHILNPQTGRPVEGVASVSVITPTATESDALSTAAFVLQRIPDKVEGLLVPEKGEPVVTDGWKRRFREEKK